MELLKQGVVIPAHPLALDARGRLDERRQRALTRYYLSAGAGGLAVGVHTTQFAIREAKVGLLRPVLELAAEEARRHTERTKRPIVRIAGICGRTEQAVAEASLARELGYDIGLLSLAALRSERIAALIDHARQVGRIIPIMGFYLQPAVGGRLLPFEFWRALVEIDSVAAIKIAPFNRYQTIEVIRAVAESGRAGQIALYTGNDDNIIPDLLTSYTFVCNGKPVHQRMVGGLLGHWAVWTKRAVEQLEAIHGLVGAGTGPTKAGGSAAGPGGAGERPHGACGGPGPLPRRLGEWLELGVQVTDANAALFDAAGGFAGCIAGIHEVLRRQGLLEGRWCLDPGEDLSPGQMEQIDRVYAAYPHLNDDDFVAAHRDEWLA